MGFKRVDRFGKRHFYREVVSFRNCSWKQKRKLKNILICPMDTMDVVVSLIQLF